MPARRFGKYEVLARLATGGAANIFLARQPGAAGFHKLVCLKTLLPERVSDGDFVAMFLDEARLAARLNHPNCVQIYDLGRVQGTYYISMEYIFGETLWNLLATVTRLRTSLPNTHVASIIAAVCDGLHHAHELKDSNGRPYNLVHRDVSPQNVMITFEGQTKVLDFGIAKAETGRAPTQAGIVKGKFSYMSPEQITGAAIDRRSDVYSLGIVLFECLASRRLYRGDSPEEIARLILEHRAPRLRDVISDVPPELDAICATALSRNPAKRYQTAHEMGEALREYLDSVRYAHSAVSLARLIEERFKGEITERRRVFETALNGTQDEMHLLKVLDARAVREIDLFPTAVEPASDFVESSVIVDPSSMGLRAAAPIDRSGDDSAADVNETLQGDCTTGEVSASPPVEWAQPSASDPPASDPRPASLHQGSGWRVELGPSTPRPPQISVLGVPTVWDQEVGHSSDETRVDSDEIEDSRELQGFIARGESDRAFEHDEDDAALPTSRPRAPIDDPTKIDLEDRGTSEANRGSKRTRPGSFAGRGTGVTVEPAHARSGPLITRSPNGWTLADQSRPDLGSDLSGPTPEDGTPAPADNGHEGIFESPLGSAPAGLDSDYDKTIQQLLVEGPGQGESSVDDAATLMTSLVDPLERDDARSQHETAPPGGLLPHEEAGTEPKPFAGSGAPSGDLTPSLGAPVAARPKTSAAAAASEGVRRTADGPAEAREVPALLATSSAMVAAPGTVPRALTDSLAKTSPSDIATLIAAERGAPSPQGTSDRRRISVSAVLLALGLGLVIGVMIGLMLARVLSAPETQVLPAVTEPVAPRQR